MGIRAPPLRAPMIYDCGHLWFSSSFLGLKLWITGPGNAWGLLPLSLGSDMKKMLQLSKDSPFQDQGQWLSRSVSQTPNPKPRNPIREFPKIKGTRVPYLGVPMIRILPFRVLYWGPLFWETPIPSTPKTQTSKLETCKPKKLNPKP